MYTGLLPILLDETWRLPLCGNLAKPCEPPHEKKVGCPPRVEPRTGLSEAPRRATEKPGTDSSRVISSSQDPDGNRRLTVWERKCEDDQGLTLRSRCSN
jgi:hypothetical protein